MEGFPPRSRAGISPELALRTEDTAEVRPGAAPRTPRVHRFILRVLTGDTGTGLRPDSAVGPGVSGALCGAEETVSGGLSPSVPDLLRSSR